MAMSVNDLLVQGAEPLYFLDYYACSRLDVQLASDVIKGIAEGCKQAGCALIGGETAEMPGMYAGGKHEFTLPAPQISYDNTDDYDLAGFAVGVVERSQLLPQPTISKNDILLGLTSTGLHSNGFSLVRKIIARTGLEYTSPVPWDPSKSLGNVLLQPTKVYIKQVLPALKKGLVKGMSHITGGGFIENIPRVLPKDLGCSIDVSTWELQPVFRFLMKEGHVDPLEMARTFNNGIGLVLVVSPENVDAAIETLQSNGDSKVVKMGLITDTPGVQMVNLDRWSESL